MNMHSFKNIRNLTLVSLISLVMMIPAPVSASSTHLSSSSINIGIGYKKKIKLYKNGKKVSQKKLRFKSNNKKVATITKYGTIISARPGKTTVKVKYKKKTYTCKVNVLKPYFSSQTYTYYQSETVTLKLNNLKSPTLKSTNTNVVRVISGCTIQTKNVGTAKIYTKYNGQEVSCTINVLKDPLKGISFVALGDSLIAGSSLGKNNTWVNRMGTEKNMTFRNLGKGGSTLAYVDDESANPMVDRVSSVYREIASPDLIVVEGGANDWKFDVPIGNDDDLDKSTFKGAISLIINDLKENCPNSKILFMTPYKRDKGKNKIGLYNLDYVNAMKQVCSNQGIDFYDNYHNSGMDFTNKTMRKKIDLGNRHFNNYAQKQLTKLYKKVLRKYVS